MWAFCSFGKAYATIFYGNITLRVEVPLLRMFRPWREVEYWMPAGEKISVVPSDVPSFATGCRMPVGLLVTVKSGPCVKVEPL